MAEKKKMQDGVNQIVGQFITKREENELSEKQRTEQKRDEVVTTDSDSGVSEGTDTVFYDSRSGDFSKYKLNPKYVEKYVEKKTRHVHLMFQPSVHEKIKEKADRENVSVNEYIHKLCEKDIHSS